MLHYHFRPGGVRRVIELATPPLVRALRPQVRAVVLAAGEPPDPGWLREFRARLAPLPVACATDPALRYLIEQTAQPAIIARRLQVFFEDLLQKERPGQCVVWAHNQSLGRNLLLTLALQRACAARSITLALHHHDWWFDNRWPRWAEMRRAGFRTLRQVAETVFGAPDHVRHFAINQADEAILRRHFPGQAAWLPNPTDAAPPPGRTRVQAARAWLRRQTGDSGPVWLMPCRLLRRKNVAEALLLARWLRPEAWVVTTGAITSVEEAAYADRLARAARRHGWRIRMSVLAGQPNSRPSVPDLIAASEVVLLTSLQEGFGLPYLEAAAAHKPLIARALPNIAPDLAHLGFTFPQSYDDLLVAPELFDWQAEQARQTKLWRDWRQTLPQACRALAGRPLLAAGGKPQPVTFSRLTLTAQLEVLARPVGESWPLCAALNPFLRGWRDLAERGALRETIWPKQATRQLSGAAWASRFCASLKSAPSTGDNPDGSFAAQAEFIRSKLATANLYPLLMRPAT